MQGLRIWASSRICRAIPHADSRPGSLFHDYGMESAPTLRCRSPKSLGTAMSAEANRTRYDYGAS